MPAILTDFIYSQLAEQIFVAVLIFLVFLIFRGVFSRFVFTTILKFCCRTNTEMDTNILLAFQKPLQFFFIVIGLYLAIIYLPLTPYQDRFASTCLRTAIIALLSWGLYNLAGTSSIFFGELERKLNFHLDKILISFASKVIRFVIIIFALYIIASEWGFQVGGFVAGLGLGGLAFALAAQDTVANIFGGIVIIIDKPFSIGDWIYTPDVEGTVEDISFRSTKVRTFAQAMVTVPNSSLAKQAITNWTRMGRRRVSFHLGVTYGTPVSSLRKCVNEIQSLLENHPDVHKQTIFVRFDKFADSSLDIFVYYFTNTTVWGEFLAVKEDINFKIMEILQREGVSVAFPSRSLYFETPLENKSAADTEENNAKQDD